MTLPPPHRRMTFGRFDYAAFMSFMAYAAGSVAVPVVLVSLARDLGFSLERGGLAAGGALHLGRSVLMVATNLWLFCGLLFLAGVATAPFWPSVQSYCADCLPGTDTTMLFILLSCAGIPGCGFFTWLMGYVGNHSGGLGRAFLLVPACYLVLAALIGYDWHRHIRKSRKP